MDGCEIKSALVGSDIHQYIEKKKRKKNVFT
jgi:hypothetical protein